jgi:hypothetical protein
MRFLASWPFPPLLQLPPGGPGVAGRSSHLRTHGNCGSLRHFRAAGRACRSPLHCNGSVGAHGGRAILKHSRAEAACRVGSARETRRLNRRGTVKLPRRQFLHLAAGAAALAAVSQNAWGQVYPTRPITIVVPYASGGSTDVLARNVAERMKTLLGQPVIIENVTGAGGSIGALAASPVRCRMVIR